MSIKYLSPSGLTEVWSNIKTYIASKIPSKIVTGLSIKGRTITYTNSDGTTGTLTTQDTNTTYASMSAAEATTGTETTARSISAKVLHDKITSITNIKANNSDVVHKSGDETITGEKTFSKTVHVENLTNYPGHNLWVYTGDLNATYSKVNMRFDGTIAISCVNTTTKKSSQMDLKPDGTFTWNGKSLAIDENVVHTSGNETITGTKTFSNVTCNGNK